MDRLGGGRILAATGFPSRVSGPDVRRTVERYWPLTALVLLSTVGFWLRIRNLGSHPFWVDEIYHVWAADRFVDGEGFTLPNGTPYDRAWLPTTLPIAASFTLFGSSEFAARLPSAVVGTATIAAAYALGREFANREVGILLSVFVAFDPMSIAWSREARMYAHLQLVYVVTLLLLARWYRGDFGFRASYLVPLGLIATVGYLTHTIYLSVGLVFVAFVAVILAGRAWSTLFDGFTDSAGDPPESDGRPVSSTLGSMDTLEGTVWSRRTTRLVVVLSIACVAGIALLVGRGLPPELFAEPTGGWAERGTGYYLDFLFGRYGRFVWLLVPGTLYLLLDGGRSHLLVLAFAIPFAVASLVELRAARYVVHLLPLFGLVGLFGLVFCYEAIARGLDRLSRRTDGGLRVEPRVVAAGLVLVVAIPLLIVGVSPATGIAITEADAESTTVSRSDHQAAAAWLDEHGTDEDALVSMRPEVTEWYVGEVEYFLRTDGIAEAERRNGDLVHTRSDAIYLTDRADVEALFDRHERGWIVASARFHGGYLDPDVRAYIQSNTVRYADEEWTNLELYYWGPDPPDVDERRDDG
ncbi:glycosyltransferase family 39 protein [Halovivax gelatinilyticus]|uniref:glycosyltransferase family 39 protein n=1 Tax=Halovivax gelatinilyticus TaxID=2961597 RepID=UPI0020CA6B06|nr:glycosyltransferase family 39 protein [Halovivax gelatinilyticus]